MLPQGLPVARILVKIEGKIVGEARLTRPTITIGRRAENDIHVAHPGVSRLHARIRAERGIWIIEDANSANGMMYRGQRIKHLALTNGDSILIAPNVSLIYETAP
jgi:peptidoglycan glycosyltransferase